MSVLSAFIERFIADFDQTNEQSTQLLNVVMQAHPVLFMQRTIEALNNVFSTIHVQQEELGKDCVRLLRLLQVVVGHVRPEMESSRLAVIQATNLLKKTIAQAQPNPTKSNEEVGSLLTEIHVRLMAICEDQVINHVSDFFESGKVPDVVILRIIGQMFRSAQKEFFRQFAYEILQKILSSLSLVKSDQMRQDYCELLQNIYHTLIYFQENNIQINQESVNNVTWLIFEQISKEWINSKETNVLVLSLVGFMCQFIPKDRLEKNVERLNQVYLAVLKREGKNIQLRALFEGFNKYLDRLYCIDRQYYENSIKSVSVSLYEFYKNPIFSPNYPFDQANLKYKNDLLSVLQTISQFNIDNSLDLFIGRINSKEQIERVSCLWVCNFLIGRNFNKISEPYKKQLVLQILNLQFEADCEVRYAICEIIFQFCQKFKQFEVSLAQTTVDMKALMFYLYSQVAIHEREIQEFGKIKSVPFDTTLDILKRRSQQILTILSNDPYYVDLLWPMTVEIINNQKFSPGLAHICKSMCNLLAKVDPESIIIRDPVPAHFPKAHVIIVRLLLLMQIPNFFPGMGLEAAHFFTWFLSAVQIKFPTPHVYQQMESIKQYLIARKDLDEFYEEKVQFVWKQSLHVITQTTSLHQIEEDFSVQLNTYINTPALKSPVLKMHAILISMLHNQETIKFNLDRIFNICHTDYVNQTINLNIQAAEPEWAMRQCIAECFGYIGEKHTEIVLEKIKTIMNCNFTSNDAQRKQTGSLKESMLSMFQKTGNQDENLASPRATLIMALGCLARRVDVNKLHEIIERNVLSTLAAFLEKPQEPLQLSLQIALENVAKAAESMLENGDEITNTSFLVSFQRHREQALAFSYRNLPKLRGLENTVRTFNTISLLMRMSSTATDYQRVLQHLRQHLDLLHKHDPNVLELEQVQQAFINLFGCFFITKLVKEDGEQVVNMWEGILTLLVQLMADTEVNYREGLFDVLQKSVQRQKLKVDAGDARSLKHYFRVVLVLLRVVYQHSDARRQAVLILEKVILALNLYLDIFQKNEDQFNGTIIFQLSQKLQYSEVQMLVWELALKLKEVEIDHSVLGFISLLTEFYKYHSQQVNKELDRFMQILIVICNRSQTTTFFDKVKSSLGALLGIMVEGNLNATLQLALESRSEFPVNEFTCVLLQQITMSRPILVRSFSYLTDILNNPEDLISTDVGNMMVNASLFIGQLLSQRNPVLEELIPKFLSQIFSTFVLRFMTCFDPKVQAQSGANASQSTIWAFTNLLALSGKPRLADSVSQHVLKKMLYEDEVEDGIQEIAMVYCKCSTLKEMEQVYQFMLPFTQKKYDYYRLGAIVVIGQFIKSTIATEDLREWQTTLLESLLQFDNDDSEKVRASVALGLGGISYIYKYAQSDEKDTTNLFEDGMLYRICESLIGSLDDSSEHCIKTAMISLQNLVTYLPHKVLSVFLPPLLLKTTSNFEKQNDLEKNRQHVQIRISAFSMFSKLCGIFAQMGDHGEGNIINNLRQALVSLMLHLVDESVQVRSVCKLGLETIADILGDETYRKLATSSEDELRETLSKMGIEADSILEPNEMVITVLVLTMCRDTEYFNTYINSLIEFCKSPEYMIKGAAVFSLLVAMAYFQSSIDAPLAKRIEERMKEVNEQKLKWATTSLIMKGTFFLAQNVYKSTPQSVKETNINYQPIPTQPQPSQFNYI